MLGHFQRYTHAVNAVAHKRSTNIALNAKAKNNTTSMLTELTQRLKPKMLRSTCSKTISVTSRLADVKQARTLEARISSIRSYTPLRCRTNVFITSSVASRYNKYTRVYPDNTALDLLHCSYILVRHVLVLA